MQEQTRTLIASHYASRRYGVATVELTVACTLLSALFAIGGALFVRVYRIGQDAHYRSIALQEVANELEAQLKQTDSQRAELPKDRRPSEAVLHRWPDARFLYREAQDSIGTRVTVELVLNLDPLAKTIQLSGWIVDDQSRTRSEQ